MPERFPCGLIVCSLDERRLSFANDYVASMLGYSSEEMIGQALEMLLSKASLIFMDSYVYPTLLESGDHNELQLTLIAKGGDRVPVLANIRANDQGFMHWALFSAIERDKMYQELIETRDQLQRQTQKLKRLAARDPLTGMLNRRASQERLIELYDQSRRASSPLTLLLIDIDHFKQVNDRFGHSEGDRVLVEVALAINSTLRSVDLGARWGGEEFLIVLYATDTQGAIESSRRIHSALEQIRIEQHKVSVSIGVAKIDLKLKEANQAIDQAISAADTALYRAKAMGRNRTEVQIESASAFQTGTRLKAVEGEVKKGA